MILIKLYVIALVITLPTMFATFKISDILIDKPKTNKFRKWWSKHIVDLDNRYE